MKTVDFVSRKAPDYKEVYLLSRQRFNLNPRRKTIHIGPIRGVTYGHEYYIQGRTHSGESKKHIYVEKLDELEEGDIVQFTPNGKINLLWERKQNENDLTLFVTSQCNANCIMCPQPPHKDDYSLLENNLRLLEYTKYYPIEKIGITGGEPTSKKDDLTRLLSKAYEYHSHASVDLLTNAKNLSDFNVAKEIALSNPNITFCISFPSDNEGDFNKIMGSDLYSNVLRAIENLAKLRQKIELRIVIQRLNYNRLRVISEFIYRNFPFVSHVVFMGMEVTGHAQKNISAIDISPDKYNAPLRDAVQYLLHRDMHISIYNLPFCVMDEALWKFLRNSISSWKQLYRSECNLCSKKNECPGLFSTSKINAYVVNPV